MIRIGVAGHRFFQSPDIPAFVEQQCLSILQKIQRTNAGVVAISPIAEGSDSIFAKVALSLGIPLEIVCPFEEFAHDFKTEEALGIYHQLRSKAVKETRLKHAWPTPDAYYEAMQWIIDQADIVVAVWDGKPYGGKGGTSDAVRRMIEKEYDWIHVNVTEQQTIWHVKNNTPTR